MKLIYGAFILLNLFLSAFLKTPNGTDNTSFQSNSNTASTIGDISQEKSRINHNNMGIPHYRHIDNNIVSPSNTMRSFKEEQMRNLTGREGRRVAEKDSQTGLLLNRTQQQLLTIEKKMEEQVDIVYKKQTQEQINKTKQNQEQIQRIINIEKLNKSQLISYQQQILFKKLHDSFRSHHFDEYIIQLDSFEEQDFSTTLSSSLQMVIYVHTFKRDYGIYTLNSVADGEYPSQIWIYQSNRSLILHDVFFFKTYLIFDGKANQSYSIYLKNNKDPHLYIFGVLDVIEASHISNKATQSDIIYHHSQFSALYQELVQKMQQSYNQRQLQVSNRHRLNNQIKLYYLYSLTEIVILLALCMIQITLSNNLLNIETIV